MKVLITGGAGFIGSHIVDDALEKGYEVVVLDSLRTGFTDYIPKSVTLINADISDESCVNKIVEQKPDVIIHCAAQAQLRTSIDNPLLDAQINIIGTINVLEAARMCNVKKFIYTSTGGGRYGEPQYLPLDEKHQVMPLSPYGISKHSAEHYVWLYKKLYGLDSFIFCFGNVYGPRDTVMNKRVIPIFFDKMMKTETPTIFGDGNQGRDFIFVKDLSTFIIESLEKKSDYYLFNLASGEMTTVNEMYSVMQKVSGFSKEAHFVDAIAGEVKENVLDCSLAKKELGWNPKTSIEDGLEQTWNWFKESF